MFFWNSDRELEFRVHWKTKQKLNYLNKGITHTNATFGAIPSGIFNRLAKITSRTNKNSQMRIDEKYQGHAKALEKTAYIQRYLQL